MKVQESMIIRFRFKIWKVHPISLTIRSISSSILATSLRPMLCISSAVWKINIVEEVDKEFQVEHTLLKRCKKRSNRSTPCWWLCKKRSNRSTPCWWLCGKRGTPHSSRFQCLRLQSQAWPMSLLWSHKKSLLPSLNLSSKAFQCQPCVWQIFQLEELSKCPKAWLNHLHEEKVH